MTVMTWPDAVGVPVELVVYPAVVFVVVWGAVHPVGMVSLTVALSMPPAGAV